MYFNEKSYYNALLNYEIYLGLREAPIVFSPYSNIKKKKLLEFSDVKLNRPHSIKVFYNIAESYRNLRDFANAEKWYRRVLFTRTSEYPLALLWHGQCMRALGNYEKASTEIKSFVDKSKADSLKAFVEIARKEINNIAYINQQMTTRKPKSFALKKMKGDVAQIEGAYAASVWNDTLVFTSARILDTFSKKSNFNQHVNHIYTNSLSENYDTAIGKAQVLALSGNSSSHNEGVQAFSPDGQTIYFTRWEENSENISKPTYLDPHLRDFTKWEGPSEIKSRYSIFQAKKGKDGSWGKPEKMNEKINLPRFDAIQPFVTTDGKYLLFSSNRPEGKGGFDLWAAELDSVGNPKEPFNLKAVNSSENDMAPFYHSASKSLIFSSNGRIGMGGYDLYVASGPITSLQTPQNLGYPMNSVKDDNYFFCADKDSLYKKSFVSSDRFSDCCLELFTVQKLPKKIFHQYLDGLLTEKVSGNPIVNGTIEVHNEIDSTLDFKIKTNQKGLFLYELNDSLNGFTASKKGYVSRTINSIRYDNELYADTTYQIEVELTKSNKKYHRKLNGVIVDCETKKPMNKVFVTGINEKDTSNNIVVTTNAKGCFSINFGDSISNLFFEKRDFVDRIAELQKYRGELEGDTIYVDTFCIEKFNPEKEPTTVITNAKQTEMQIERINKRDSVVIFFDFNKTDIRPDAAKVLDQILANLKTYPRIALELNISGHTDAIGSEAINKIIGRKRAISCLDYLIQKGISESRLKLNSRGKSAPIAPDRIGNKDNPAGRAKNRRVELKVRASLSKEIVDVPTNEPKPLSK